MNTTVWSLTYSQTSWNVVKWALGSITTNKASRGDGIPVELFLILKMMLWNAALNMTANLEKPSSGHRTGKVNLSSQFPRRTELKNVQTTGQLHSCPILVRLCSKSFKIGFSSTWIENFQMYRLGIEMAEEPEIKLTTFVGSERKQGNSRKHLLLFHWLS